MELSRGKVLALSGMEYNMAGSGYRCVIISGNALEIEGIRSVAFFSAQSADFNLKRGRLKVTGESLKLTALSRGYACISGRIDTVATEYS